MENWITAVTEPGATTLWRILAGTADETTYNHVIHLEITRVQDIIALYCILQETSNACSLNTVQIATVLLHARNECETASKVQLASNIYMSSQRTVHDR